MKLIDLMRLSNARFYALEIYGANGKRAALDLDIERESSKHEMAKYAHAEVVRIQPIINNDTEPALEVQLYV